MLKNITIFILCLLATGSLCPAQSQDTFSSKVDFHFTDGVHTAYSLSHRVLEEIVMIFEHKGFNAKRE